MIDVTEIVIDPDFEQSYTVYRKTGAWGIGGKFVTNEVTLPY